MLVPKSNVGTDTKNVVPVQELSGANGNGTETDFCTDPPIVVTYTTF